MSLFKEEMKTIERFMHCQYQVYNDSADFGIRLDINSVNALREALQSLRKVCPTKPSQRWGRPGHEGTRTEVFVPWEMDGGMVRGTLVVVSSHNDRKGGFFSIEMHGRFVSAALLQTKLLP